MEYTTLISSEHLNGFAELKQSDSGVLVLTLRGDTENLEIALTDQRIEALETVLMVAKAFRNGMSFSDDAWEYID